MNALDYNYPKVTELDVAFPTLDTPEILLTLAKEKGFYNAETPANKLFSQWFYGGLPKMPEFKAGVDKEKAQKAMNWVVVYMGSFAPKHEHKEAVCALIFNEALEIPNES